MTVALLVTMVAPLFLTRIPGGLRSEYLDGWNRAHGIAGYYNPNDDWTQAMQRRIDRGANVVRLFTVRGDSSPVRNITGQPPLIDPVTCALLVLGIAAATANLWRPVYALTLLGLLVTVSGTLILTGNFDVARVGGAVPYVYALAGFGAAGIWTAWSNAWGRVGRALALVLLSVAVAGSAYWCTASLRELWTNPIIRRSHRNNLAYLTIWLRDHQVGNERVLGIAPGYDNALLGHDGSWLRGRQIDGYIGWDIESTLRRWEKEPGPTLLFIYAGRSTEAITEYLEKLLPELKFQIDVDPLDLQADVAWARVPGPPPALARRLADWNCRGVHAEYSLVGAKATDILYKIDVVAPFICKSTWPASVPDRLYRLATRPDSIQAHYASPFMITKGGDYLFSLDTYAGTGTLMIDGEKRDISAHNAVPLEPGTHNLEVQAQFAPMAWEPVIRLTWAGPDSDQRQELMPFYRIAPLDPSCADREQQAPQSAGAAATRNYLINWLTLGPFTVRTQRHQARLHRRPAAQPRSACCRGGRPTLGADAGARYLRRSRRLLRAEIARAESAVDVRVRGDDRHVRRRRPRVPRVGWIRRSLAGVVERYLADGRAAHRPLRAHAPADRSARRCQSVGPQELRADGSVVLRRPHHRRRRPRCAGGTRRGCIAERPDSAGGRSGRGDAAADRGVCRGNRRAVSVALLRRLPRRRQLVVDVCQRPKGGGVVDHGAGSRAPADDRGADRVDLSGRR